jgi:hypothetical protein
MGSENFPCLAFIPAVDKRSALHANPTPVVAWPLPFFEKLGSNLVPVQAYFFSIALTHFSNSGSPALGSEALPVLQNQPTYWTS